MLSRSRLKYLRSLRRKKVRAREGLLLVEGLPSVTEAVMSGRALEIFLAPDLADARPTERLRGAGLPVHVLDPRDVDSLAQTRTPAGAFALANDPCGDLDTSALPATCLLLLAAGVADPGNLGTLVRTAAGLGADAVVTTEGTVESSNPKAVRASAGAIFRIPVLRGSAAALAEGGVTITAADADGRPVSDVRERAARLALAVGSEPHGLPATTRALARERIGIPLSAGVESLNVAVAAGILLHALARLPVKRA